MVKEIMRDPLFLAQKSVDATEADTRLQYLTPQISVHQNV